ncbi:MAG: M48 family metallopeptidase [Candidatus Falkowbacteria bacterium]
MFSSWVNRHLKPKPRRTVTRRRIFSHSRLHYLAHKEEARRSILPRLAHFAALINVEYKRVFIKNQRSRWGSCSEKGNLNFNYRLALLPEELMDYVIVHELCHLAEFNHSPKFWQKVGIVMPNYKELRLKLKKINP